MLVGKVLLLLLIHKQPVTRQYCTADFKETKALH